MKQSQEVPCHVFSEYELLATMASHPYDWARAKSGQVFDVLSEERPSYTNSFRFSRRSFRDCFPIAAICLDTLRDYYVRNKPLVQLEGMNQARAFQDSDPERFNASWTLNSYSEFISADIFEEILYQHITVQNQGLQKVLDIIAQRGGEYNDIDEIRAALLMQHLNSIAMTATCNDTGVQNPVFVNSKEIIQ